MDDGRRKRERTHTPAPCAAPSLFRSARCAVAQSVGLRRRERGARPAASAAPLPCAPPQSGQHCTLRSLALFSLTNGLHFRKIPGILVQARQAARAALEAGLLGASGRRGVDGARGSGSGRRRRRRLRGWGLRGGGGRGAGRGRGAAGSGHRELSACAERCQVECVWEGAEERRVRQGPDEPPERDGKKPSRRHSRNWARSFHSAAEPPFTTQPWTQISSTCMNSCVVPRGGQRRCARAQERARGDNTPLSFFLPRLFFSGGQFRPLPAQDPLPGPRLCRRLPAGGSPGPAVAGAGQRAGVQVSKEEEERKEKREAP